MGPGWHWSILEWLSSTMVYHASAVDSEMVSSVCSIGLGISTHRCVCMLLPSPSFFVWDSGTAGRSQRRWIVKKLMHWQGKAYSKDSSPFTAGISGQLIWSRWVNAALQNIIKYQESKALLLQNWSFSTYTQMGKKCWYWLTLVAILVQTYRVGNWDTTY